MTAAFIRLGRHLHFENGRDAPSVRLRKRQRKKRPSACPNYRVAVASKGNTHLPHVTLEGAVFFREDGRGIGLTG